MTSLTVPELYEHLHGFSRSGLHFQRQRHYAVNHDQMGPWLDGDLTTPPSSYWPGFAEWADLISAHVAAGRRVERLRVHAEPMTPCQQWEHWLGRWNIEAGETIRYLPETTASALDLTDPDDWWLLDDELLIVMPWSTSGHDLPMTATTEPAAVAAARGWWKLGWDAGVVHDSPDR